MDEEQSKEAQLEAMAESALGGHEIGGSGSKIVEAPMNKPARKIAKLLIHIFVPAILAELLAIRLKLPPEYVYLGLLAVIGVVWFMSRPIDR